MAKYAVGTDVEVKASKDEIERTLQRYGADQFAYGWQEDLALIGFRIGERQVKILLPLPLPDDESFRVPFRVSPTVFRPPTPAQIKIRYEQACRQRWRALALVIKAKLEAVETGISTIEREFLADTLLANGQTVGQWVGPQLARLGSGEMPALLPGLSSGD